MLLSLYRKLQVFLELRRRERKRKSEQCKNCYGKGYYSHMSATVGSPDFIGDKGFRHERIHNILCKCEKGAWYESMKDKPHANNCMTYNNMIGGSCDCHLEPFNNGC